VAPRDQFAKFESEFVASARATQGAYDPGAFHWSQFLLSSGFSAAVAGAVGALIAFMRRRHHEAEIKAEQAEPPGAPVLAPAPAKVPLRKPSKHVWYCDSCGNPVPMRLEQCRCGGKKPA